MFKVLFWVLLLLAIVNSVATEVYRIKDKKFMENDYSPYYRSQTILLFIIAIGVAVSSGVLNGKSSSSSYDE